MEPWKPALAAIAASVAGAQAQQALRLDVTYTGKVPTGKRDITVQVGDLVTITTEGDEEIVGRRLKFHVDSHYFRYHKEGCTNVEETVPYKRPRQKDTHARLFVHFYPAVIVPGSGPQPIPIRDKVKTSVVVREAGLLRLTDLVIPHEKYVLLGRGPQDVTLKDMNEGERAAVKAEMASRAGHVLDGYHATLYSGSLHLRVVVRVTRP
jgi:hypothetical protein